MEPSMMAIWTVTITLTLLLNACASQPSITAPMTAPMAPLTPIAAVVGFGVLLEDLAETPEEDAKTATILEVVSDCLSAPWQIAMTYTATIGGMLWTIADMPWHGYARGDFQRRADTILSYLPHESAAPESAYRPAR